MRITLMSALFAAVIAGPALAQDNGQRGVWAPLNGVGSADLAIRGWSLAGTTGLAAGPETGLVVTFWRAADGVLARCVFSLVSATGTQPFETCSVATTQAIASGTPADTPEDGDGE